MTPFQTRRPTCRVTVPILLALFAGPSACRGEPESVQQKGGSTTAESVAAELTGAVVLTLDRSTALADSTEDLLRPVPLLRPGEEAALRRYSNAANLERARMLGARPADSVELASLIDQGRLVRLEEESRFWVIRELHDSRPYVTPDTRALLERLGRAFQERLAAMGLPAFRFEVSSVLRTAEDQAALRSRNANAASTSAHEYGTTVDIAYSGYAAPAVLPDDLAAGPKELVGPLELAARAVLERVAARKSRELKAILGEVLEQAQADGGVLVTLERLQPVYHLTVARRFAE